MRRESVKEQNKNPKHPNQFPLGLVGRSIFKQIKNHENITACGKTCGQNFISEDEYENTAAL